MVGLFGTLIVLGAASVRLAVEMEERATIFVLPAVAFGYLAAVLFDNRMGTLMALAMAVLAAAGTQQAGIGVYALLATIAPIGFVSSASTRHAFRNSVVVSALAASVIAAAVSWLFYVQPDYPEPWSVVSNAAGWAFVVSLVAALVAQPALAFFEAAFDITTTLRLLELTDRNHEALQLIQEKAFGTFNHSLMVGTLADAAARAVGANNLLARAAAYYHDLGKTENPLFFIENQFGVPNPHDLLDPEESAEMIRRHVTDGLVLARRYRIPSEVAEGIVAHHGDGIMRYFYEKARQQRGGEVDPDSFRHAGHKPVSKEMAIVMMADAVEGACRAMFGEEEPTADAIAKVVNRVIDEKVADGQLSQSDLTLGELTRVRHAFIEALTGHYHQRIPYPNFPGS
jgi:putative nucleotidyltransferase with HDIG domain